MRLSLSIVSDPSGNCSLSGLIHYAQKLRFTTLPSGDGDLEFELPISLIDQAALFQAAVSPHCEVSLGGYTVWQGRLDDITLADWALRGRAYGYWVELMTERYTGLFSSTQFATWRPVTEADLAGARPSAWSMDTNNRLYVAPQKDGTYATGTDWGALTLETPVGGQRTFTSIAFDYQVLLPANWRVQLQSRTRNFSTSASEWLLTANGVLQTGSVSLDLTGAFSRDRLVVLCSNDTGVATYPGETGANYMRITNLRVKSTAVATSVTADLIAAELVDYVRLNSTSRISASKAHIQNTGLDLRDEIYEDMAPADILKRLAGLGDNQTPARVWEVGVGADRQVFLRPKGSAGQTWYCTLSDEGYSLQRSLSGMVNKAYAKYKSAASSQAQRTAVATDVTSIARFGVTQAGLVSVDTTSATQAATHRDAMLNDKDLPAYRTEIQVERVFNAVGTLMPKWIVRAGDTMVIRDLPTYLIALADQAGRFLVAKTTYSVDEDQLTVSPETPLPALDLLMARRAAGVW